MSEIKMEDNLSGQLHEQYAINNNANFNTFVSFLVSLFVLFGSLGYAFVSEYQKFLFEGIVVTSRYYYLLSLVVCATLLLLAILSLTLGYSHRRDQLIAYRIRKHHYTNDDYSKIFDKQYNPLEKTYWSFIPDVYNYFYWAFITGIVFVITSCVCKYFISDTQESEFFLPSLILQMLALFFSISKRCCIYVKYKDLSKK
uniref:hypothetical protein n=1 Tax=Prevotellamassilia timonensis TaxID=1852370 RepID=UPI0040386414